MNGVSAQINGGTRNKSSNKGSWGEINKSGSIIFQCFVYNFIEHKIYNYPFKGVTQEMFKEKVTMVEAKKDVVNMVMAITTCRQLLTNVVFMEK